MYLSDPVAALAPPVFMKLANSSRRFPLATDRVVCIIQYWLATSLTCYSQKNWLPLLFKFFMRHYKALQLLILVNLTIVGLIMHIILLMMVIFIML